MSGKLEKKMRFTWIRTFTSSAFMLYAWVNSQVLIHHIVTWFDHVTRRVTMIMIIKAPFTLAIYAFTCIWFKFKCISDCFPRVFKPLYIIFRDLSTWHIHSQITAQLTRKTCLKWDNQQSSDTIELIGVIKNHKSFTAQKKCSAKV